MKRVRAIYIGTGILLLAILIMNCIIIFKDNSKIARSYYISEYERVELDQQRGYLEKEAMIVPEEEIRITADANALAQISVRPGQKVSMNEIIASYKTDEIAQEQSKLQSEINAYERELNTLEGILERLEAQGVEDPITSIDSEQVGDELSVTVETEITQGSPFEAIATIQKQMAEVERNMEILQERISELSFSNVLSSPIEGVIGEIVEENGNITFVMYTDEKNLITYISQQEWEQVMENQTVELERSLVDHEGDTLLQTDTEDMNGLEENEDEELLGVVVEKQDIPATDSLWFEEMGKVAEIPEPLSFEVRVDLDSSILNKPYASLTSAKIIINEASNALRVKKDWLVEKKVATDEGTTEVEYIYSIDEDGKIRTNEVKVAFEDNGETILTSNLINGEIIFHDRVKDELSNAFFPMPSEIPSKAILQQLDWKQYAKYLIF
ncbi:efflux RND transporter periplasmic adaptor subunit [Ureibacillus sinduriensis]|uniref:HlyD family secretion protein n=1 Tax=Ureibacillus sinduriensis BLB-1 = JCM 15800 TaxID=1384057 RepID=A0A0A3HPL3_9BACL|nr:hypothetical protein [Ureibacillus sinduriensis]KGR74511.1 hypothetical protein CD33_15555 [Ureibacillus sinduriensis BLB-1 = JCM 15800]